MYYLLSLVAGVRPLSLGFRSISIEPHLGSMKIVDATIPHRLGSIHVKLQKDNGIKGEVILPPLIDGIFRWNGIEIQLNGGTNKINLTR